MHTNASNSEVVRCPGRLRLFRRRTIICPTWAGSICIIAILALLAAACFIYGETYLALTHRVPADILVVEGWIGRKGLSAAVDEFKSGGYRYVVASGGLTSGRWEDQPESYAEMAAREMRRLGVPREEIVIAKSDNTESHRTFESAVAVWRTLRNASIKPKALNVFTLGPHARRSALVFEKVESPAAQVGVIGWVPPEYKLEPWWRSSERSRELIEETVGYFYELLLNSGRRSNAPRMVCPLKRDNNLPQNTRIGIPAKEGLKPRTNEPIIPCRLIRDSDQILCRKAMLLRYANVIFDHERAAALRTVHGYLDDLGIAYCGRYGDWGYMWTDESFESGENAAEKALRRLRKQSAVAATLIQRSQAVKVPITI